MTQQKNIFSAQMPEGEFGLAEQDDTAPLITIVIAIRNAATDLAETLENLRRQDFRSFEVLIADANSTDDPARYLGDLDYPVRHIVQRDSGIYDAWNKVLPLARGEWVSFMGAGDTFLPPDTLTDVATVLRGLPDTALMAYGRVNILGENGRLLRESGAPWPQVLDSIRAFEGFSHQATFQRRRSFSELGLFDDSFRIAGDTEMFLRVSRKVPPVYFPLLVSNFRSGGISSIPSGRLTSVREITEALKRHGARQPPRALIVKAIVVDWLHRILPEPLLRRGIDAYRRVTGRPPRYD